MKKPLIPAVAISFAVISMPAFAAPAHADAQEFFNYMQSHGYTNTVSGNGLSYLDQGQQVCQALRSGGSENSEFSRLDGLMSNAESDLVVTAAHKYLCPGA
jgi:Protein of unknown function (DUF732)